MKIEEFYQDHLFYQAVQRIVLKLDQSKKNKKDLFPLLVTSALPSEGKTLVSIAFSLVFAIKSKQRCLLVDANWNQPKLHQWFGMSCDFSVKDLLDDPSSCVQQTGIDNLDLLAAPSTKEINSPGFLFSEEAFNLNERYKESMMSLVESYPNSIFDSTAVTTNEKPVLDPLFLASFLQSAIMVILAVQSPKQAVKKALFSLGSFNQNVMAVCNNKFNRFYKPPKDKS